MKKPVKIALWCLGVGLVLAFIGLDPLELWISLGELGQSAFDMLVEVGRWAGPFMLAGAVIVLPIVGVRWLMRKARERKHGAAAGAASAPPQPGEEV